MKWMGGAMKLIGRGAIIWMWRGYEMDGGGL